MLSCCDSLAANTVCQGCRIFWAFIKTWVSEYNLQKNLGPTADPEIFENLDGNVCILLSAQQYALNRKRNNNVGMKIDFRPHFSFSVAPAELAAGMAQVSLLGKVTPLRSHPPLLYLLGAGRARRGLQAHPAPPGRGCCITGDPPVQPLLPRQALVTRHPWFHRKPYGSA